MTRQCNVCGQTKPVAEFPSQVRAPGRKSGICKACFHTKFSVPRGRAPAGLRKCRTCKTKKDVADFDSMPDSTTKLRRSCRDCVLNAVNVPRRCVLCGEEKPADQFQVRSDRPNGRESRCYACKSLDTRTRYKPRERGVVLRKCCHLCGGDKIPGMPCAPCKKAQRARANARRRGKRLLDTREAPCATCGVVKRVSYACSNCGIPKRYGMTAAQYAEMLTAQNGACALCRSTCPDLKGHVKRFSIDHVHDETKRVRGLLCHTCNKFIGEHRDNVESIRAAAQAIAQNIELYLA